MRACIATVSEAARQAPIGAATITTQPSLARRRRIRGATPSCRPAPRKERLCARRDPRALAPHKDP